MREFCVPAAAFHGRKVSFGHEPVSWFSARWFVAAPGARCEGYRHRRSHGIKFRIAAFRSRTVRPYREAAGQLMERLAALARAPRYRRSGRHTVERPSEFVSWNSVEERFDVSQIRSAL